MQDWKTFLQPAATVLVALSIGAIAVDQYRTSNARFNCAYVFSTDEGMKEDLKRLGLSEDGNYKNIRAYCRAFLSPENIGGGHASIDFPSQIDVSITDMPRISGDVRINGNVDIEDSVRIYGDVGIDGGVRTY